MIPIQRARRGHLLVALPMSDGRRWWRWLWGATGSPWPHRTRKVERYRWGKPTAAEIAMRRRLGAGSHERLP